MLDYRKLLWKYMNHVGDYEGSTFLTNRPATIASISEHFTDDEWAELKVIEDET